MIGLNIVLLILIYPNCTGQHAPGQKMDSFGAATGKQFLLIHGGAHGAWCWYKLSDLLQKAGHTVTALDMSASGINPRKANEIRSLEAYSEPLLDFMEKLTENEKVILVGHSFGGFCISLAMEMFPHKVSAAVFVTAFMPQTGVSSPLFDIAQIMKDMGDSNMNFEEGLPISVELGSSYAREHLYQNCSTKDMVLSDYLRRPFPTFNVELLLTQEKYGSVKRTYVVCKDDKIILSDFQLKSIEENPPHKVYEIHDADHFPLLSCPAKLADILTEVAHTL